ncbi:unnamed protein product [Pylaiella littoralis]
MRFRTTAGLALIAAAASSSVSGFVSPPPTTAGAGCQCSSLLRHDSARKSRVALSSVGARDRAPRGGAVASALMSLKPFAPPPPPSQQQQQQQQQRRRRLLPRGMHRSKDAAREGFARGSSPLRGAASDEDDEMYEYEDGDEEEYSDGEEDLDRSVVKQLKRSATVFRQVSWVSWWAQTILSTVAFIILLFSNAVTNRSARGNILGNGVALALASLACSAASICWTWGYTLKAKGWRNLGTLAEVDDAQLRMRNSLRMGLYINVAGMLLALIGAEQIVGTLVAKVLYSQGFQPSVMVGSAGAAEVAQAQFRALDVFIVQANTNTLLSHFCSLAGSLWLLARTPKLAKLAKGGSY